MSKYLINGESIEAIADGFRTSRGTEQKYTLDEMAVLAAEKVGGGGAGLNIAYGDTSPEDTTKLWVKAEEPDAIKLTNKLVHDVGTFLKLGSLPNKQEGIAAASVGSKVYLMGGYSYNGIRVFDTETNSITTLDVTLPANAGYAAASAVGSKVYVFGGSISSTAIYMFDTENNTIETLSATLIDGARRIASAAVGDAIYLFGGESSSKINTISKFDTITNTISRIGSLPEYLYGMAAASVGTIVYLFGGKKDNSVYKNIYAFDTETNVISTLSVKLPESTYGIAAEAVDNNIYLFGGNNLNTVNVFNPETQTIKTLDTTLPDGNTSYIATATVGNTIYLFGGSQSYDTRKNIFSYALSASLATGDMLVEYTSNGDAFPIVTADGLTIEVCVTAVHIGDENGVAQSAEAFIYKDDAWTAI